MESVFSRMEKRDGMQAAVMQEMAKATAAQAASFATWLEMFKQGHDQQLTSLTVRPQDELDEARKRERERLMQVGFPIDKSAEEQLSWFLANDFSPTPF